jgi:hypothetical protein
MKRVAAALVSLTAATPALADEPDERLGNDMRAVGVEEQEDAEERPHTMFLGSVALLALPGAEVCPFQQAACEPGETSLALSLFALGRIGAWSFGGSFTYGFGLRPTEAAGSDQPDLEREHRRLYLLVEGHFRRYLPPLGRWNWWVGTSLGVVVINDQWSTLADREPYADTAFVGPRAVTLATEGVAFGAAIGGHIRLWDYFLFGTHFRYANWLLPSEREATPVGDLASLAGRLDVIDVGAFTGFYLPI